MSVDVCWSGWALDYPGRGLHVEYCAEEEQVWRHALGWPDAEEIAYAKSKGARAFRCRITEEPKDAPMAPMEPIPISAARDIAERYHYDQVIIYARKVGEGPGFGEHMTTYGRTKEHCGAAAKIGNFLKHKIMGWPEE